MKKIVPNPGLVDPRVHLGAPLLEKILRYGRARKPLQGGMVDFIKLPLDVLEEFLEVLVPCIACGTMRCPFRCRKIAGHNSDIRIAGTSRNGAIYFSPTCPPGENPSCCRVKISTEYKDQLNTLFGYEPRADLSTAERLSIVDFLLMDVMELFSEPKDLKKLEDAARIIRETATEDD